MGAEEPVVEGANEAEAEVREGNVNKNEEKEEEEAKDLEKGEVDFKERAIQTNYKNAENRHTHEEFQHSMYHRLNPTNPLRIVMNSNARVASPSPVPPHRPPPSHPHPHPQPPTPPPPSTPPESQPSEPRSIPILQPQRPVTLNSRRYTNRISLFLFLVHFFLAVVLVCFLVFKGIQGLIQASDSMKKKEKRLLKFFLPQVEAACLIGIILAFTWQKAIRKWPTFMVHFILWCSFLMSLAAGVLLLCFQRPTTSGVGVCLIAFSVGNGLYACWVYNRIKFCCKILSLSLQSVSKFPDLNYPSYCMLGASFLWMTLWTVAVIGAMNFVVPPLIIMVLMLSLAWITEVMRNVVNITVSRVISLYYLRGMQSSTKFCFLRAVTRNLGSACLGSLFVPTIEALRIIARGLNLLEGQDEFLFCCAHCCLRVMESIFRNGNSWAYVQIAAYGKSFVTASRDTWALFEKEKIEHLVNSDITSSVCFLTGVCSGSICVIVVAAWTAKVHHTFTATLSLLTFFIGYLLTRIAMAVPHACVSCYYVCYAENPENRLFDKTIKDRLDLLETHKDATVISRV
ncbi:hypothetical protein QN277_002155 [Acacia crassicarpa]|uniref:Choline transporter-like protein n=1 Tax=Acacia crassicarpa TaxID=499986 RepID=A0AAE1NA16_9FABA|nr:hypothetical protein QN277_002155 [Acacia crassicarpa]